MSFGTEALLKMVEDWNGSGRVVCADAFFSSVETAKMLFERGLRFIGVVKNSTKEYPMSYLSHLELAERGEHRSLASSMGDGMKVAAVM